MRSTGWSMRRGVRSSQLVRAAVMETVEMRQMLAGVTGSVFNDVNANGRRDNGESGAAGATIWADYDYNGAINGNEPTATSGANGAYTLTVNNQSFPLRVRAPAGGTVTAPANAAPYFYEFRNNTLTGYGGDFGVTLPPTTPATDDVNGYVQLDANGNGQIDLFTEPGVGGQTVYADYNYNGTLDAGEPSATTFAADGSYLLKNVRRVAYALRLKTTAAYAQITPANAQPIYVEYRDGAFYAFSRNFGVRSTTPTTSISGTAYVDANGNGKRDAGETGVRDGAYAFSMVYVDYNANGIREPSEPASRIDANTGAYTVNGVTVGGTYTLRLYAADSIYRSTQPAGYGSDATYRITTTATAMSGYAFGVTLKGSTIAIRSFRDLNRDGVQQDNEDQPIGHAWIDLDRDGVRDANEPTPSSLILGGHPGGAAYLTSLGSVRLLNGTYRVALDTDAGAGDGIGDLFKEVATYDFTNPPGTSVTFAVPPTRTTTSVAGIIYEDFNGNGQRDAGDTQVLTRYALQFEVYVDLNGNDKLDAGEPSALHDYMSGTFLINNVPVGGTYAVRYNFPQIDNKRPTQPAGYGSDAEVQITTTAAPITGVRFGFTSVGGRASIFAFVDTNKNGVADETEPATGVAWIDFDRDGVRDANEPSPNITYELHGSNGLAYLGGVLLAPGTYRVALDTTPNGGDGIAELTRDVTVTSESPSYPVAVFAIQPPRTTTQITGHVFNDVNGNGRRDVTEGGSLNQTVFADYNYNGVLDDGEASGITDIDGNAALNVQARPFALRLRPAADFTQSSPANNGVYFYELRDGVPVGYGDTFGVRPTQSEIVTA